MDKWGTILLEAEEMWEVSAAYHRIISLGCETEEYRRLRDEFKADRIYALYGYEAFYKFVIKCPHIHYMFAQHLPCKNNDEQCSLFCYYFKDGGCTYATE
jgi:hypothetical protein